MSTPIPDFLVAGPQWRGGDVPSGFEVIKSPTRYVWIIGCTQTNDTADYENVHKVQDGYRLTCFYSNLLTLKSS
ncbi:MAG: DUF1254 domain-containing protein [Phyllobacterium sp.]